MLDPSADINENFQTTNFLLDSGITVSGVVVEETPTIVKVVVDPLAKAAAVTIEKTEIDERLKSPVSIMPDRFAEQANARRDPGLTRVRVLSRRRVPHAIS